MFRPGCGYFVEAGPSGRPFFPKRGLSDRCFAGQTPYMPHYLVRFHAFVNIVWEGRSLVQVMGG